MDEDDRYTLEPYQNGREHGWSIQNRKTGGQVAFSEFRRSDQIVVYLGTVTDFEMAGNVPSDKVYNKKEFFSYDQATAAARRIIEYLGAVQHALAVDVCPDCKGKGIVKDGVGQLFECAHCHGSGHAAKA